MPLHHEGATGADRGDWDAPAPGQRLGHVVLQLSVSHVANAGSLQNLRYLAASARHAVVSAPHAGSMACAGVSICAGSAGVAVGAAVSAGWASLDLRVGHDC